MASLGVLASLMQGLTPTMPQYNPQEVALAQQRLQSGRTGNETALIELQRLKQSQASEAEMMAAIQNNPALAQQLLGGSTLGSIGPAGGPGGMPGAVPGPMTQSPLGGGATQQIPAYPDASRYAGVSPQGGGPIPPNVMGQVMPTVTPPPGTPTLATIGPQGGMPGPPQGQQNALLEMARRDPRAAMMLQQQMQGQQDLAMKRQEQRLKIGEATLGYVGQQAQGVTDQASLEAMRSNLQSQGLHQYAAQLPQFYSKEAMAPFIAKAVDVKSRLTLEVATTQAQAEVMRARMAGRVAKTDQYLKALGVTPGTEQPEDMQKALAWQQRDEIAVSTMHGAGQVKDTPLGAIRIRPTGETEYLKGPQGEPVYGKPNEQEQKAATFGDLAARAHKTATALEDKGFKPSVWEKGAEKLPLGISNYLTSEDYQSYRQAVGEFAQAWLRKTSGAEVNQREWDMTDQTYFPQPGESKARIEQKREAREAILRNLQEEAKPTGRTGTQAQPQGQPQGQAPTASSGKPVSQMSRDELLAERDRLRKGGS